jgi:PAS domain-containing protein
MRDEEKTRAQLLEELAEIRQRLQSLQDISERKQPEENIVRLLERLNMATHAASLGIWDWDIQKDELVWDDRMYELYGVKREGFSGAYVVLPHKNGHLKQPVESIVVQTEQGKDSPGLNDSALDYRRSRYTQIDPDGHHRSPAIGNDKPVRF